MKKIIASFVFVLVSVPSLMAASTSTAYDKLTLILNPQTGRPDYINNFSSFSIGNLFGVSTRTVTGAAASDGDVLTFKAWASSVTIIAKAAGGSFTNFLTTTSTRLDNLDASTATFRTFQSTTSALIASLGSSTQAFVTYQTTADAKTSVLSSSITTLWGNFYSYTSTSDAKTEALKTSTTSIQSQLNAFSTFRSSADTSIANLNSSTAAFQTYFSTNDAYTRSLGVVFSSNSSRLSSTGTWTASQVFLSSMTFSSNTINIGGNYYFFPTSAALTDVDLVFHYKSSTVYLGGDNAGSGGGSAASIQNPTTGYITHAFGIGTSSGFAAIGVIGAVTVGTSVPTSLVDISSSDKFAGSGIRFSTGSFEVFRASGNGVFISSVPLVAQGGVQAGVDTVGQMTGFSFSNDRRTGMFGSGGGIFAFRSAGTSVLSLTASQVSFIDGTSGNPGIAFINSVGTGFMRGPSSNNNVLFQIGGITRMRINDNAGSGANGQVVIGAIVSNAWAGLTVSTGNGTPNVPIMGITSDTIKMEVTGTSATFQNLNLIVISSPTGNFTTNVSSYSFAVSSSPNFISVGVSSNGYLTAGSSMSVHQLTSCGTSTLYGGGNAFSIIAAGAPSGCTVTFVPPFSSPPIPIVSARVESLVNSLSYTITNTQLVLTQSSMGNIDVILLPRN